MKPLRSEHLAIASAALGNLRRGAWPMLIAMSIAEAVAALVLTPLGAGVVNRLIRQRGHYAVANEDLVGFFLSPLGLVTLFVSVTVGLTVAAVARASALLALHGSIGPAGSGSARRVSGVIAFVRALAHLPRIIGLTAHQTGRAMLIAAPFAAAIGAVVWWTLRGVDVYWLVNVRPPRFWIGLALAAPMVLAGAWVVGAAVLRWSIALPLCVLCGRDARGALRESGTRMRGRVRTVAIVRLVWLGLSAVAGAGALAAAQGLAVLLLRRELGGWGGWGGGGGGGGGGGVALTAILAGAALLAYAAVAFAISLLVTLGDVSAVHAVWMRFAPGAHASALPVDVSIGGRNGGGNGGGAGGTRWRVGACLCVVAVGSGLVAARLLETVRVPIGIEVTAHRGAARVAPENTLASIRAAAAMGADRVEFDVMQSADGGLVLFHDTDLRRIANDPRRVAGMTLEELRGIDAGSWFSAEFAGERIPTLEEALDEAVRGGIAVNMELKAAGDEETLAQRALAVLREHRNGGAGEEGAREWAIVTSLSAGTLAAVRREDPGARIGLIVTASVGDLRRADVDLLAVESRIATGRFVRRAKQAGLQVHVWGVTDPDQFTRLALQGVEGVITSEPGSLLVRRAELARLTEVERLLLAFRMRVLGH